MKKIISIIVIIAIICTISIPIHARVAGRAGSAKVSSSGAKSSATSKPSISGAKTYTTPKNFKSKYNPSNIKTEKVQEATNYSSFSATNIFRPNFWTAMWAFQCMNNNNTEVSEQDIAKELEERGYSEEEIKEILKEGEQAKQAVEEQEQANEKIGIIIICVFIAIVVVAVIIAIIIFRIKKQKKGEL